MKLYYEVLDICFGVNLGFNDMRKQQSKKHMNSNFLYDVTESALTHLTIIDFHLLFFTSKLLIYPTVM